MWTTQKLHFRCGKIEQKLTNMHLFALQLIDYPIFIHILRRKLIGRNGLRQPALCGFPLRQWLTRSLIYICEPMISSFRRVMAMVFGILVHELLPMAIFFWFIFIISSWNLVRLAIRRSIMLGGIGLMEPCNSTKWKNSRFVKLFFWIRSSTTASMSVLFCCKI